MKKPKISGLPDVVRKSDMPYKLSATPKGGIFNGDGVKDGVFDPIELTEGIYEITYSGETKSGEKYSITKKVEVLAEEQVFFAFHDFNDWIETKFYDWIIFGHLDAGYIPSIKMETIPDRIIKLNAMHDEHSTIEYLIHNVDVASCINNEKKLYLYDFLLYLCNFEKNIKIWDEINIDITNDVNYQYSCLIYENLSLKGVSIENNIINLELIYSDYYLDN